MSTMAPPAADPGARPPAHAGWVRLLRWSGWTLISIGAVLLLYLVYSLYFTNVETNAAQAQLLERWELEVGAGGGPARAPTTADDTAEPADEVVDPGGAEAVLEFHRPGSETRPVRDEPLFVVSDVTLAALQRGPGRYPESAAPGEPGNFAVAGHRSTYGAPFFALDELIEGDEVHVTARDGQRHVYRVLEQRIVAPSDVWVLEPDPLGTGTPMLTLTTCHPRFSNAERMIVFAELVP